MVNWNPSRNQGFGTGPGETCSDIIVLHKYVFFKRMWELVLIQSKFPTDTFVTSESKLSERESKI